MNARMIGINPFLPLEDFAKQVAAPMITYGQVVSWSPSLGIRLSVSVIGFETREDARREAIKQAKELGWTPPRWWQWWRRSELVRGE